MFSLAVVLTSFYTYAGNGVLPYAKELAPIFQRGVQHQDGTPMIWLNLNENSRHALKLKGLTACTEPN